MFFYIDTDKTIDKIESLFMDYRDANRKDQIDRINAIILRFNQIQHSK